MKKLNLFISSFSQNIISSFILVIILVLATLSVQDIISQYRYINYSKYIIENKYLQNSDYFMINPNSIGSDPDELFEYTDSLKEQIAKMDGVKGVANTPLNGVLQYVSQKTIQINYRFYNEHMINAFSKQLSEGTWFDGKTDSNIPDVVVCGAAFNEVSVGNTIQITLTDSNYKTSQHKVHIVGKINYPWYCADYHSISNDVSTKNFLNASRVCLKTLKK